MASRRLKHECLRTYRVNELGPLAVGAGSHGESVHHVIQGTARKRLEMTYACL